MRSLERRKEVEARTFQRVLVTLILMVVLIGIGSIVLSKDTDTYKEALYQSVSLVTNTDLDEQGQGFFSFLLRVLGGLLGLFIMITLITLIFEGHLQEDIREEKRMKKIQSLTGHIIICGGGRVGSSVAKALGNVPFVIIDENAENVTRAKKNNWLAVEEDSLDKKTLEVAGIKNAKTIISCLDNDGDNVLQVITAKELNPNIRIISRAEHERTVEKLKSAGAAEVIMPTNIGGQMLAKVATGN